MREIVSARESVCESDSERVVCAKVNTAVGYKDCLDIIWTHRADAQ